MSKETYDTLGNQKIVNYALQDISRDAFIKELTTGILPAPQYFAKNASLNKNGYKNFSEVLLTGSKGLSAHDFEELVNLQQPLILDVRPAEEFAKAHIPNSLFIGLDGQFAPWVGTLIRDIETAILLVTPEGKEEEAVMRLSRVGYDNCVGFLDGGLEAWIAAGKETDNIKTISPELFIEMLDTDITILDVRKPGEFAGGHLKNVESNPLDFIFDWVNTKDITGNYMVHCAGGYRSMIALSILKMNGFVNVTNVNGGYSALTKLEGSASHLLSEQVKA